MTNTLAFSLVLLAFVWLIYSDGQHDLSGLVGDGLIPYGEATGTGTALLVRTETALHHPLRRGVTLYVRASADNGGAATAVNVNGTGAKPLVTDTEPLTYGNINVGDVLLVMYDGSYWLVIGQQQ